MCQPYRRHGSAGAIWSKASGKERNAAAIRDAQPARNYGFEVAKLGEAPGKGSTPLRDCGEGQAARGRPYPLSVSS